MILTKKEKTSLKPLSEKEIQRKLYGNILSSTSVEEAPETRWTEAPKPKEQRKPIIETPRFTLPQPSKINISIPWEKIGSTASTVFKSLYGLGKIIFSRMATVWGMGALIVAVLFISVHSLNTFRTKAMKAPKQDFNSYQARKAARQKEVRPKLEAKPLETAPPLSPVTKEVAKETTLLAVSAPPDEPIAKEPTPLPPTANQDPYVIQVCTYASQADAEKLIEELKAGQFNAFFQSSTRSSGKTYYPVYLGRFKDLRQSQAKLKEFRSKLISKSFPDSFIRTLS